MGGPRDWLMNPADFGTAAEIRLRAGDSVARAHARLCHDTVVAVNTAVAERGWTRADLAHELAVDPRYLQRKLSGHAPITLHDLACWATVLGLEVSIT
jgi:ribosome-binding protein aMBF1 (putative translation factor)